MEEKEKEKLRRIKSRGKTMRWKRRKGLTRSMRSNQRRKQRTEHRRRMRRRRRMKKKRKGSKEQEEEICSRTVQLLQLLGSSDLLVPLEGSRAPGCWGK